MNEILREKFRNRQDFEWNVSDENGTREFALTLSSLLDKGDVLALVGDLGTGKTTMTRYIAEGLGIHEKITSPTFTIIREYRSGRIPLYHFDIYRLGSGEELLDIGAEEYFYDGGVCIVEWADRAPDILPENTLIIKISYGQHEGDRIYRCIF